MPWVAHCDLISSNALHSHGSRRRGSLVLRARTRPAHGGDHGGKFSDIIQGRGTHRKWQGFEELLPLSNQLNRKLEEVLGMTREYETIASLWHSFHTLMRNQKEEESVEGQPQGMPGTGGHVLKQSGSEQQ